MGRPAECSPQPKPPRPAFIIVYLAYGGELEMGVRPIDDLSVYGSVLYGKSEMDSDTTAASGAIVPTKGNDTPDFPKFMLKRGLSYRLYGLVINAFEDRLGGGAAYFPGAPFTVAGSVGLKF